MTVKKIKQFLTYKIKSLFEGKKEKLKMSKKNVLDLTLKKEGMESVLHIKAAKEFEDFFKKAAKKKSSSYTETSNKWLNEDGEGLEFYIKNEKLNNKVSNYGPIIDNFGNGLVEDDGRINLAILRIVGISDGVTVKTNDMLSYQEVSEYIQKVASWGKAFYEENLRDGDLSATVNFEVE